MQMMDLMWVWLLLSGCQIKGMKILGPIIQRAYDFIKWPLTAE